MISLAPVLIDNDVQTRSGCPLPLGVTRDGDWKNFAVFSTEPVSLIVFNQEDGDGNREFALDYTGDVWHIAISDLPDQFEYAFRVTGCENLLLDPYGRAVSGSEVWGQPPARRAFSAPWDRVRQRRSRYFVDEFDWESDEPVRIPWSETVIYELHVRGFTRDVSSQVTHPGSYLGLIEKIPYLLQLGVTTVELMPVMEWDENDNPRVNPTDGTSLVNFWGYHPLSYFAPKAAFASEPGAEVDEFREMVKAFHRAGIEVVLDVVYNHTGEAGPDCPTSSFRALADSVYYASHPPTGGYRNDSGCGNTLSTNHPVVQDLIIESLRYWVTEMHVDGFRFDLAAIFSRGRSGEVLDRPPILDRIESDPVLSGVKLIAEPWDAAGLYQVGAFAHRGRWAEWNDHFRDDVRRFIKGDAGMTSRLATRLSGSRDIYPTSNHAINFVASHDGFTLADVVSYNDKCNIANGEGGRDGCKENHSWNCGIEGPSHDPEVRRLRLQQIKNAATLLYLSQGVPMLLAGDEFGRTQNGNNNAYCQDGPLTWVNWQLANENTELLRFFRMLSKLRRNYVPVFDGVCEPHIRWHGCRPHEMDFGSESRIIAMQVSAHDFPFEVYLAANMWWQDLEFTLPKTISHTPWRRIIDTSCKSPLDIFDCPTTRPLGRERYAVNARSVVVMVAGRGFHC